jgi:hypothetical protein
MSSTIQKISHGVKIPIGATAFTRMPIYIGMEYIIVKIGRSTGWTTGVINAAKSILAYKATNPHGKHTLCHVVHHTSDKDFGWDGDSGSLIMLDQANDKKNSGCGTLVRRQQPLETGLHGADRSYH